MNERELRALRGLADNLQAIREEIHAIHDDQKSDKDTSNQPVQPFQIEVTKTPHLDAARQEYYHSENRDRNTLGRKIKPWLEGIGILIALVVTYLNLGTLRQVQRQADIVEADNRPWIKIVDITIDDSLPEALSFMPFNKSEVVDIRLVITIRNIGKSVARDVFIAPVFVIDRPNSTTVDAEQVRACSAYSRWSPGPPFVWSTVFPEETRKSSIATLAFYTNDMFFHPKGRPGNWIGGKVFGCVSYQAPRAYTTSAAFTVMGEHDRFLKVGEELDETQLRLARDEHYDRAQ